MDRWLDQSHRRCCQQQGDCQSHSWHLSHDFSVVVYRIAVCRAFFVNIYVLYDECTSNGHSFPFVFFCCYFMYNNVFCFFRFLSLFVSLSVFFGGQLWWASASIGNHCSLRSLANKLRSFVRSFVRLPFELTVHIGCKFLHFTFALNPRIVRR